MNWILERLKERNTWIGLVSILSAIGVGISPEQSALIASVGVGIAGLIFTFTKDDATKVTEKMDTLTVEK